MRNCPEREAGTCSYELSEHAAIRSQGVLGCLAFAGFFTLISTMIVGVSAGWRWGAGVVLFVVVLVSLFFMAWQRTFLNPATGAMWQQVNLFGVEVSRTVVGNLRQLDLGLTPMRPLTVPASIAVLTTESATALSDALDATRASGKWDSLSEMPKPPSRDGALVFTAALAGLLAQGVVSVQRGRLLKRRFQLSKAGLADEEDVAYLLTPGQNTGAVSGALEQHIVERLSRWDENPEHSTWPQGPPLYELVHGLFDEDMSSPDRWLAAFAVDEATSLGVGRMVKGSGANDARLPPRGVLERVARAVERWAGHFELNPAYVQQMRDQREVVLDLLDQLEDEDPHFTQKLREETERAIDARESSD
jgi:hypothetical protein